MSMGFINTVSIFISSISHERMRYKICIIQKWRYANLNDYVSTSKSLYVMIFVHQAYILYNYMYLLNVY